MGGHDELRVGEGEGEGIGDGDGDGEGKEERYCTFKRVQNKIIRQKKIRRRGKNRGNYI